MFTMGNTIWYPHRGCRNLVLPYRIYNDSIKPDSKSFRVPGFLTREVPESGTCIDQSLVEEVKFINIGTNVDTGMAEYLFLGTIGTNVDQYFQNTDNVGNGSGVDVSAAGYGYAGTDSGCDITSTTTVNSLYVDSSQVNDSETESDNEIDNSEVSRNVTVDNEIPGDGTANGSGDTEIHTDKSSDSCTCLAFWNSNNCNTSSDRDLYYRIGDSIEVYKDSYEVLPRLRPSRLFPPTEVEHRYYDNPGEYIIVQGSHGYGRVEKNPDWTPGKTNKPEWWPKFISWSCRVCVVGIFVLLGYCACRKYQEKNL